MALTKVTNNVINTLAATKLTGQMIQSVAPAGSVIGTTYFENSTRTVYSSTGSPVDIFGTLNVTKNLSSSYLIINAQVMSKNIWSYANNWYFVIGGTTYNGRGGWNDTANSGTNSGSFTRGIVCGPVKATGLSAGNVTVGLYLKNANGAGFESGFIINPNSSDDARYAQQVSSITITEVAV